MIRGRAIAVLASLAVLAAGAAAVQDGSSSANAGASCLQLLQSGVNVSGSYWVGADSGVSPVEAYCDQTTDGGGWMLIHKSNAATTGDRTDAGFNVAGLKTLSLTESAIFPRATINAFAPGNRSTAAFRVQAIGGTHSLVFGASFFWTGGGAGRIGYYTTDTHTPAGDSTLLTKQSWAAPWGAGVSAENSAHGLCLSTAPTLGTFGSNNHICITRWCCTCNTPSCAGFWFNGPTWTNSQSYNTGYGWVRASSANAPPSFTAGPTAGAPAETSVSVSATLSEPGRLYCAAVPDGTASPPTSDQVQAGSGGGILSSAASSSTFSASVSLTIGSLASNTAFDVYCVAEDSAALLMLAPVKVDASTADLSPPVFAPSGSPSALVVVAAGTPKVRLAATTTENSRLYCAAALHVSSPAAFTSQQVKDAGLAAAFPTGPGGAFVAGGASLTLQLAHTLDVTVAPATAYDVYCVAEDGATSGKLRVLDNLQAAPTLNTVFTGGCLEGNATVRVPTLNLGGTSISGSNLVVRVDSSRHFRATRLAFVGSSDADCTMQAEVSTGSQPAENEWLYSADSLSCNDAWTYTYPLTSALAECNFAEQGSTAEFTEYRATLEATTVENGSLVFGVDTNRTERTAIVMGVRVPNLANVTNNASVFGAAIPVTATTTQVFDTVNRNFSFVLATSVQHPYELFVNTATASGQTEHTVYGAVAENDCASAGSGECLQRFAIGLRPAASFCTVNSLLTTTFRVRCRASFTGACDAPSLSSFTAAFQVLTDDFCARVVEIGAVTPSLEVYDSEAARDLRVSTAQTSDAVTSSLLFYRVDLVLEAGLLATSLNLTDVRIRSFCAGSCTPDVFPVANGAVDTGAFAAYGFQITSQEGSRADFQFQINDNSISFDNNDASGSVNVQVTVGAVVNYTAPSGQKLSRRVELLAAAGGSSAAVSASAQFGATSAPAAPASVSGESTVLGMTQGTALVAGVGLVAIVALAAGAAVVGRRRRAAVRSSKPTASAALGASNHALAGPHASSSAADLCVEVPVDDLRSVQGAYGVTQ